LTEIGIVRSEVVGAVKIARLSSSRPQRTRIKWDKGGFICGEMSVFFVAGSDGDSLEQVAIHVYQMPQRGDARGESRVSVDTGYRTEIKLFEKC